MSKDQDTWAIDHAFKSDDEMVDCLTPPDEKKPFGKYPKAKFHGRNIWTNSDRCPNCLQKFIGVDLICSICRYCKKNLSK